jgi:hypothetical protein
LPLADLTVVLTSLESDEQLRRLLRTADLILLSVGDDDPMSAPRDGPCDADRIGRAPSTTSPSGFDCRLRLPLAAIDGLRRRDAAVVVVAAPDPRSTMAAAVARSTCRIARQFDGDCVDGTRLVASGAVSPHDWSRPDYQPVLRQRGHDSIARDLLRLRGH